jgi:hypothetical protein
VEFREVSEFRFLPRNANVPFSEDECINAFGYWTDEEWANNRVIVVGPNQTPETNWLMAIEFMSGAVIAVQAASAHARVDA